MPQSEVQTLPDCGPLHHVGVAFEQTADCGPNEVGPVRIETFLHHEVDLPEVDVAEIDRDLFAVSGLWAELMHLGHYHHSHLAGWHMDGATLVSRVRLRISPHVDLGGRSWKAGRVFTAPLELSVALR
jgi:hypothetical protein